MSDLRIYDCLAIEKEIELLAAMNDGEIPEEKLQELVKAQTTSLAKIENLCQYLNTINGFIERCKQEQDRISKMRRYAYNRMEGIKRFLTPFVEEKKKITAGTFTLSTRKSIQTVVDEGFENPDYCEQVITWKPDKTRIKEDLQKGLEIPGCRLQTNVNLQIR